MDIKGIIESEFGFKVKNIVVLGQGLDSIAYLVNEEYIFKMSKHEEARLNLKKEIEVLDYLQGKITLQIPNIEFYSEKCGTCKEFYPIWVELTKNINYLKIGRVNIDNEKGLNVALRLNALENGIPCVKLNYGKDKIEDIMIGTEDPLPNANILKDRIDKVLNKKGKLKNGKYFVSEDL